MWKMRYLAVLAAAAGFAFGTITHETTLTKPVSVTRGFQLPSHSDDVPANHYLINMSAIGQIACGDTAGTGEVISKNKIVTAYHVISGAVEEGVVCKIGANEMKVLFASRDLDFAIMEMETGSIQRYEIDCSGFKPKSPYIAVGYPDTSFIATMLTATGKLSPDGVDRESGQPFKGLSLLTGNVYRGMSGGPVLGVDGNLVGIIVATSTDNEIAGARAMKDTPLCQG